MTLVLEVKIVIKRNLHATKPHTVHEVLFPDCSIFSMVTDGRNYTVPDQFPLIFTPITSPETISSTRRFFCLPSLLSFDATGME
jgi:hypothetical protein